MESDQWESLFSKFLKSRISELSLNLVGDHLKQMEEFYFFFTEQVANFWNLLSQEIVQTVSAFQKEIRQTQRHSSINRYWREYTGMYTLSHISMYHMSNGCESQRRKKAGGQTHVFLLNKFPHCQC